MSIQFVTKDEVLYALVGRRPIVDGVQFFTPAECDMQVGVIQRPAGHHGKAHSHSLSPRVISSVSEFLYVEKGRIDLAIFDESWSKLSTIELVSGDFVLLLKCGHELKVLEDARLIEVKQGPAYELFLAKTFKDQPSVEMIVNE